MTAAPLGQYAHVADTVPFAHGCRAQVFPLGGPYTWRAECEYKRDEHAIRRVNPSSEHVFGNLMNLADENKYWRTVSPSLHDYK